MHFFDHNLLAAQSTKPSKFKWQTKQSNYQDSKLHICSLLHVYKVVHFCLLPGLRRIATWCPIWVLKQNHCCKPLFNNYAAGLVNSVQKWPNLCLVKPLKLCRNEVTERRNFSFIIHLIFHPLWTTLSCFCLICSQTLDVLCHIIYKNEV